MRSTIFFKCSVESKTFLDFLCLNRMVQGRIEDVLQSHHIHSGEELEALLRLALQLATCAVSLEQ